MALFTVVLFARSVLALTPAMLSFLMLGLAWATADMAMPEDECAGHCALNALQIGALKKAQVALSDDPTDSPKVHTPEMKELKVKAVEAAHARANNSAIPCQQNHSVACIIDVIDDIFAVLNGTDDLSPRNFEIDASLTKLVSMCLMPQPDSVTTGVLASEQVKQLSRPMWQFLSKAEFEMESWWAQRFLSEAVSLEGTNEFWYRQNYQELTQLELSHLESIGHRPQKTSDHLVFVGGGPLPFSAIEYSLQTGHVNITIVEQNLLAAQLSRALLKQLGFKNIHVEHAAGEQFDYNGVTHLVLAALVRNDEQVIRRAMKHAGDRSLAVIGVRSATGLRSVLYAPLDFDMKKVGLKSTGSSPVNQRVINTLLTFEPA